MGMKTFSKLICAALLTVTSSAYAIDIQSIISSSTPLTGGTTQGTVSATATALPYCSIAVTGSPLTLEDFKVIQLESGQYVYAANTAEGSITTITAGYSSFSISATATFNGLDFFEGDVAETGTTYVDVLNLDDTKLDQLVIATGSSGSTSVDVESSTTHYKIGDVLIYGGTKGFKDLSGSVSLGFTISCGG